MDDQDRKNQTPDGEHDAQQDPRQEQPDGQQAGQSGQPSGQGQGSAPDNLNDIFGKPFGAPPAAPPPVYSAYRQRMPYGAQPPQQQTPPPQQQGGMNPYAGNTASDAYRKGGTGKFVKGFVAVMLALMMFVAGFLTAYVFAPSEEEKLARWISDIVASEFYDGSGEIPDLIDGLGKGMAGGIDAYSSFYAGQDLIDLGNEAEGEYNDSGMILYQDQHDPRILFVLKVYRKSPAGNAGVLAGDVLKKVNGVEVGGNVALVRSEMAKTSSPEFTFERSLGNQTETVTVSFASGKYEPEFSVYADNTDAAFAAAGMRNDTGYITFEEFAKGADEHFAASLAAFKAAGKKKLILDLRTNFGGRIDVLASMASHLMTDAAGSETVTLLNAYFKNSFQPTSTTKNLYADYGFEKIVVLCNDYSASATEVLMCAMLDYGSITFNDIVGVKSYGKAVMQAPFPHSSGKYLIYVTVAVLFAPVSNVSVFGEQSDARGFTYNKQGFAPVGDNAVPYNRTGSAQFDNQLLRAIARVNEAVI